MRLMLAFTNSSHHSKGTAVLTSKPWQIQPLTSSQCGYPVVTRLLQASLRSESFRGRDCWCGREMTRRRQWVNVWESGYSTRRLPSLYMRFPIGGVSMAITYKNRGLTWKVKAPREDGKREGLWFVAGEHLKWWTYRNSLCHGGILFTSH